MRLENAPLVHVLAQVVFAPVLTMDRHVPAFQQRLGPSFPRFRKTTIAAVPLLGAEAGESTVQWEFANREQQTGLMLTPSSLVLHTSAYLSKEPFIEQLRSVLIELHQLLPTLLVERIGMRYVDLVRPDETERYEDYIHAGLLGFPFRDAPQLNAVPGGFLTQSVGTTPTGFLAIRSGILPPSRFLPLDLDAGMLRAPVLRPTTGNRPGLAVDFDHFTVFDGANSSTMDFDPDAITGHLLKLHRTLRGAFDVIATPYALERWGPWIATDATAETTRAS